MRRIFASIAASLGILLAGCALDAPPVEELVATSGIQSLAPGATRAEVVSALAASEIDYDDGRFLIAWPSERAVYGAVAAIALVEFDEQDRARRIEFDGAERTGGLGNPYHDRFLRRPESRQVDGRRRAVLANSKKFDAVGFSADGMRVFGSRGRELSIWETDTGQRTAEVRHVGDWAPNVSPHRRLLAVSQRDGIALLDFTNGRQVALLAGAKRGVVFSDDGTKVAAVVDDAIKIWGLPTGRLLLTYRKHPADVGFWNATRGATLALSPDGRLAASHVGWSKGTRLWNTETGQDITLLEDFRVPIFLPDSSLLDLPICVSRDGTYNLRTPNGELIASKRLPCDDFVHGRSYWFFSPNCALLAMVVRHNFVFVWRSPPVGAEPRLTRCQQLARAALYRVQPDYIHMLPQIGTWRPKQWPVGTFSDQRLTADLGLAICGSNGATLIDLARDEEVWRYISLEPGREWHATTQETGGPSALSPDLRMFAIAKDDGIHLWDLVPTGPTAPGAQRQ